MVPAFHVHTRLLTFALMAWLRAVRCQASETAATSDRPGMNDAMNKFAAAPIRERT